MTLSHCWGPPDKRPITTTTSNLESRIERIRFKELPRIFQDALARRESWASGISELIPSLSFRMTRVTGLKRPLPWAWYTRGLTVLSLRSVPRIVQRASKHPCHQVHITLRSIVMISSAFTFVIPPKTMTSHHRSTVYSRTPRSIGKTNTTVYPRQNLPPRGTERSSTHSVTARGFSKRKSYRREQSTLATTNCYGNVARPKALRSCHGRIFPVAGAWWKA